MAPISHHWLNVWKRAASIVFSYVSFHLFPCAAARWWLTVTFVYGIINVSWASLSLTSWQFPLPSVCPFNIGIFSISIQGHLAGLIHSYSSSYEDAHIISALFREISAANIRGPIWLKNDDIKYFTGQEVWRRSAPGWVWGLRDVIRCQAFFPPFSFGLHRALSPVSRWPLKFQTSGAHIRHLKWEGRGFWRQ